MSLLDLTVISVLAIVALMPLIGKKIAAIKSMRPAADNTEQWRQKWVSALVTLGHDIESDGKRVANAAEALRLSRELTWEIIGGDAPPPQTK